MLANRHLPLRAGALVFLLLLAGACRANPPFSAQPASAGTPAGGPITLILWHSETGAARTELEALARDFHAAYPDLIVTPLYVGNSADLAKQVTAAIALERMPDLALASREAIAGFARQGGLLPLDSFVADSSTGLSEQDRQDLFPGLLEEGQLAEFGSQQYAFPFDLEGMVLFYNASLLHAGQLKVPATWPDFADVASKLTKDDQFGWAMNIQADVFAAMLASQGSAMMDLPERRALFDERAGLGAMTLASQLTKSGAAHVEGDAQSAVTEFAAGRAGLYIDWMSRLPAIQQAQKQANTTFQVGIANLPQSDPSDPYMLVRGTDLALFKVPAPRAASAWLFIRWLTAPPQSARWSRAAGALPLQASALAPIVQDAPNPGLVQQMAAALGNKAPNFLPLPGHSRTADVEGLMTNAWSQIVLSKADISATLTAAGQAADQILAGSR